ncbi:assembly factor cbp4 [Sporothrix brasiliensis 5110]|uniref:Cytochrome b mRNA-processing protein 4 n=1 Tax=Sporothrix brasiliensis 5110 TaxID=1398154 RepID=A0A0C2F6V2_9PEZI|nr:assembly factor cbp4 [Sporothrix brasiliensis 5110]KIH94654.1 assembly factor cbp4 [Sporothrix brasiliensis 5110]
MSVKKPTNYKLWAKMLVGGAIMCVGGPMLTVYVMPTDEELFQRYNPELQKRSLDRREERQAEFNEWLQNLKRQSMSNKPIWVVQEEEARDAKEAKARQTLRLAEEARAQRDAMRKEAGLPPETTTKR